MLRLADHWVWDSWLAVAGAEYHLFFLRASRALHDPERRHLLTNAVVGAPTCEALERVSREIASVD